MKKRTIFAIAFGGCLTVTLLLAAIVLIVYRFGGFATIDENKALNPTGGVIEETYTASEVAALVEAAKKEQDAQTRKSVLEALKLNIQGGKSVVESFRAFYADDVVLATNGKYYFIPRKENLKKNTYDSSYLNPEAGGQFTYNDGAGVVSHKGIDVSKFQGDIDWKQVAQDGVEFAFIRVGYRGYGENGTLAEDVCFDRNIQGAKEAGIKVGAYFYTQATTEEELMAEVALVLEKLAPYEIDCPVVYDVEKVSGKGRMNNLSVTKRTELTKLFCEKIKAAGYKPMIYHNMEMSLLMLNMEELEEYDKWFAYFNKDFYYPYAYDVWQYSEKGKVKGISTDVDLNISFKPLWD